MGDTKAYNVAEIDALFARAKKAEAERDKLLAVVEAAREFKISENVIAVMTYDEIILWQNLGKAIATLDGDG